MEHLPTVKIKCRKTGQVYVVNESDYRNPDGTPVERYKDFAVLEHRPLTPAQVGHNEEGREKLAQARATSDAKDKGLRAALDEVLADPDKLEAYVRGLPNKSAVQSFALSQGVEVDAGMTREAMDDAVLEALNSARKEA